MWIRHTMCIKYRRRPPALIVMKNYYPTASLLFSPRATTYFAFQQQNMNNTVFSLPHYCPDTAGNCEHNKPANEILVWILPFADQSTISTWLLQDMNVYASVKIYLERFQILDILIWTIKFVKRNEKSMIIIIFYSSINKWFILLILILPIYKPIIYLM